MQWVKDKAVFVADGKIYVIASWGREPRIARVESIKGCINGDWKITTISKTEVAYPGADIGIAEVEICHLKIPDFLMIFGPGAFARCDYADLYIWNGAELELVSIDTFKYLFKHREYIKQKILNKNDKSLTRKIRIGG